MKSAAPDLPIETVHVDHNGRRKAVVCRILDPNQLNYDTHGKEYQLWLFIGKEECDGVPRFYDSLEIATAAARVFCHGEGGKTIRKHEPLIMEPPPRKMPARVFQATERYFPATTVRAKGSLRRLPSNAIVRTVIEETGEEVYGSSTGCREYDDENETVYEARQNLIRNLQEKGYTGTLRVTRER